MAALDFPATPTNGQKYSPAGGPTYTFDGVSWSSEVSSNVLNSAATIPTTGTWARGDIVYNSAPVAGGNVGWICVAAGTPGTWKTFGTIAA